MDIHKVLPKFPIMIPGMKYAGPNYPLEQQIQTDKLIFDHKTGTVNRNSIFINPGNEPVSPLDEIALRHDCEYLNASRMGSDELRYKHMADARMIEAIEKIPSNKNKSAWDVYQRVVSGLAKWFIKAKYKLGLGVGIRGIVSYLINTKNKKEERQMKKALIKNRYILRI